MHVNGRCHCGQITYEADVDPERAGLCHCRDCQMLTGSAFRVTVPAAKDAFRLLTGRPTSYVKTADSGNRRRHAFCPTCGTPVYACAAVDDPPTYSLRIGCLDAAAALPPRMRIWCDSALPWSGHVGDVPGTARQ